MLTGFTSRPLPKSYGAVVGNYSSPEYAGLPHRGRVTDAEREYVRNNLEEVNRRRVEAGHDPIDPTDPRQAERYGLPTPQPHAVESEMQDQAN
jgi:hypothetical protein